MNIINVGRYTDQKDVYGKIFLVKDDLKPIEWKLESETKFIGEYECFKATMKREIEVVQSGISINGDKDLSSDENEEPEMKEITVQELKTKLDNKEDFVFIDVREQHEFDELQISKQDELQRVLDDDEHNKLNIDIQDINKFTS